ncbi:Clavaminate synthase-like protein [Aspergillus pseudonomiae]|uniref:Clavaminate synthase-like protein n=1 Tax=Aspergillus pseudonomiae TaxID=1506151 RepID=A0A5N7DIH1_9EURO|nr:Clavaminate synthase-like protein [Aspergillus pseudonomiae]KAE8405358.1 Clavaminate synthase-like protein [Aspergillus pseudonomiae]
MGSIEENYPLPLVSYLDLLHEEKNIRDSSRAELVRALGRYGACRVSDHGIPQTVIDKCFEKCPGFFERPMEEKIADHSNSGATRQSRFVPYASELIRGEPHMDETLELQYGVYGLGERWSAPASELVDAAKAMHEECNRIYVPLLDALSSELNLPHSLNAIHSKRNSFFAPYYYPFDDEGDLATVRVAPHMDPTTMLFNFQDSLAGLHVADMHNFKGNLSTTTVAETAPFVPANCKPGEFLLLSGHIFRRMVDKIKHSVHRVERPLGTRGYHLNYWIIPDLNTNCDFGEKKEDVRQYLARVFPAPLANY